MRAVSGHWSSSNGTENMFLVRSLCKASKTTCERIAQSASLNLYRYKIQLPIAKMLSYDNKIRGTPEIVHSTISSIAAYIVRRKFMCFGITTTQT